MNYVNYSLARILCVDNMIFTILNRNNFFYDLFFQRSFRSLLLKKTYTVIIKDFLKIFIINFLKNLVQLRTNRFIKLISDKKIHNSLWVISNKKKCKVSEIDVVIISEETK